MLGPCSDYFVGADKRKHKEHTRTMVEEAHSFAVGTSHVVLGSPVVLVFAFFAVVGRCSGPPFLNLRRLIRVVRNLNSG